MSTTAWADLSPEQKCVIVNAIDEGDLSSLLYMWDPNWADDSKVTDLIGGLGNAVHSLASSGHIEVNPSGAGPVEAPLSIREVREVVNNPGAWLADDDGLDVVVWLVLTSLGHTLLKGVSKDELYGFGRNLSNAPGSIPHHN